MLRVRKGVLQITEKVKQIPSHEEVRNIFNETYNVFYKKWRNISAPDDWKIMRQEAIELDRKYPYSLCHQILLELIECIEANFIDRRDTSE